MCTRFLSLSTTQRLYTIFKKCSFWWHVEMIRLRYIVCESCLVGSNSLWPHGIVHVILQARIPEWVAVPFSRGSSQPRDRSQVSCIAGGFFTSWGTREAQEFWSGQPIPSSAEVPDPGIEPGSPALQADSLPARLSKNNWLKVISPLSFCDLFIIRGYYKILNCLALLLLDSTELNYGTDGRLLYIHPGFSLLCFICRIHYKSGNAGKQCVITPLNGLPGTSKWWVIMCSAWTTVFFWVSDCFSFLNHLAISVPLRSPQSTPYATQ